MTSSEELMQEPSFSGGNGLGDATLADAEAKETGGLNPIGQQESRTVWVLPVALGLFVVLLVIALPANRIYRFAFTLGTFQTGLNFLLVAVGSFLGVFLLLYAILLSRAGSHSGDQFRRAVILPLVLWFVAVAAVGWSFNSSNGRLDKPAPLKPCAELYLDALKIAKDRPGFAMQPQDPDEIRCTINRAVLGQT